jgi:hypothetical protein
MDIAGLQENLSAVMGAMEGDIPREIREAVLVAEGDIDIIRFTYGEARQAAEVDKAVSELEELIAEHYREH